MLSQNLGGEKKGKCEPEISFSVGSEAAGSPPDLCLVKTFLGLQTAVSGWGGRVLSHLCKCSCHGTECLLVSHASAVFHLGGRPLEKGNKPSAGTRTLGGSQSHQWVLQRFPGAGQAFDAGLYPRCRMAVQAERHSVLNQHPLCGHCCCTHQHMRQSGFPSAKRCSIKSTSEPVV